MRSVSKTVHSKEGGTRARAGHLVSLMIWPAPVARFVLPIRCGSARVSKVEWRPVVEFQVSSAQLLGTAVEVDTHAECAQNRASKGWGTWARAGHLGSLMI